MGITRRQVLVATGAMAAAATVGIAGTAGRWVNAAPAEGLVHLASDEHAFVNALAGAWMPAGGEVAIAGEDAGVGDFMDEMVGYLPELERTLFKTLLQALDERTVFTHGATFKNLALQTRSELLERWMDSPLYLERQATGAVLALVAFGYTRHPEVSEFLSGLYGCGYGT